MILRKCASSDTTPNSQMPSPIYSLPVFLRPRRLADTTQSISSLFKQSLLACSLFSGLTVASLGAELTTEKLAEGFSNPSGAYRPWVWAHWLHGNVDRASITRELEAMKRAGLGGLTMFDVAQPGIPAGEHKYMQPSWQEMFGFEIAEAKRLGLEVMTHNGPGYCGNGGPWMPPERAAQTVVSSALRITGGQAFRGALPQPAAKGGWYRDIAVLAVQETDAQSKPPAVEGDAAIKRLKWLSYIGYKGTASAPLDATAPADLCIPRKNIVDVSSRMSADGTLAWDAPPGEWTILRFGHTWTGQETLPATPEGLGPECDKLDPRGIRLHFEHVMKRLVALGGPASGANFHSFFADSWEAGGQNWTEMMPQEFRRRRGYDPIPFLPILTGRVLDDLQTSERFLYDMRQTVSELATEHFWGELRRLCNARGMRFAAEPYITTGNDLDAGNHLDEPMGEFWMPPNPGADIYRHTTKLASSVANLNGKLRVGVESFTSNETERWRSHPAMLKPFADQIFCWGGNRLQVHRFAMQRFPQLRPGMMMGPWGLQYDSTQTWWEWSKPWHDYIARCQFLLSQGPVVTDVLDVAPEEPLWRFNPLTLVGYDYDACGPDSFRRMVVKKNGRTGIPDGPDYVLLRVSHNGTMTLARLRKLRDLVADGANLLADPPQATPGLEGLPQADVELKKIADELWGTSGETERVFGKGRIFRNQEPAAVLTNLAVPPDFSGPEKLTWIHRRAGDADIYFIASEAEHSMTATCTLRVSGKRAELWDPETGKSRPLATTSADAARSTVQVPLGPTGSAFVIFRPGKPTESIAAAPQPMPAGTFSFAGWAAPTAEIELPAETVAGIAGLAQKRNDALAAPPGHFLVGEGHACAGLSIGQNGVVVYEHSANYYVPVLVHATSISDWTHVAVVYQDGMPTLYLNGKQARQGKNGPHLVHSPVPFSENITPAFRGKLGAFSEFPEALTPEKIGQWIAAHPPAVTGLELSGPWQVTFDPKSGGSGKVEFNQLDDWSKRPEEGIRNYSGTAIYQAVFKGPKITAGRKVELDLGKVAVMARVQLNGKDLGILWKPPYRVDVTDALRTGENTLKIAVVNLWINRLIGDAALPEDSKRDDKGVLQSWPDWALSGGSSPSGRRSFVTIPQWKADEDRVPSGLLGPVTARPSDK
jgi:hypothetical protein